MATKIIMNSDRNTTELRWLDAGESFLHGGVLCMYIAIVLNDLGAPTNAIRVMQLSNGYSLKLNKNVKVEPVDIEIKVVRK